MALALNIGKCSLLGNYRENNEDAVEARAFPDMTVCIVAAGMGGQAAGEMARQSCQLTVDHALAEALVQAGTISRDEAREHKFKNVLWKYLGSKEVGEGPEVVVEPVQPGDRFLMCSDGLSGVVTDEQLAEFM